MSVGVNPPNSDAVVEIADELVARYVADGWSVASGEPPTDEGEPAPKRRGRPPKSAS